MKITIRIEDETEVHEHAIVGNSYVKVLGAAICLMIDLGRGGFPRGIKKFPTALRFWARQSWVDGIKIKDKGVTTAE